jgi:hypothetical protein
MNTQPAGGDVSEPRDDGTFAYALAEHVDGSGLVGVYFSIAEAVTQWTGALSLLRLTSRGFELLSAEEWDYAVDLSHRRRSRKKIRTAS